jgi:hypothetical protein
MRLTLRSSGGTLNLNAQERMAVNVVYASIFESGIDGLQLGNPAASHRSGPDYLNVLRVLDVPQAVTMAAERVKVVIHSQEETGDWRFPTDVANHLGWGKERFGVRPAPKSFPLPAGQ